jgi:hypothetical protein
MKTDSFNAVGFCLTLMSDFGYAIAHRSSSIARRPSSSTIEILKSPAASDAISPIAHPSSIFAHRKFFP